MKRADIIDYLLDELEELRKYCEKTQAEYNAADHMTRIGMASRLDKAEEKYYHFWMVCNDLRIVE